MKHSSRENTTIPDKISYRLSIIGDYLKVRLINSPSFHAVLVFIFFFFLYLSTAPRTNVSYADSDLLTVIGYQLGVAHPPGYPIYILLLHFFTHLPIPGTIAFRSHLLSIVLQSGSLAFIFLSCVNLLTQLMSTTHKNKVQSLLSPKTQPHILDFYPMLCRRTRYYILLSYAATFSLGLSSLYWLYGSIAEKYPLNHLFISVIIYLVLLLSRPSPGLNLDRTKKYFVWLFCILALALNHHQTILLYLPMICLLLMFKFHQLKPYLVPSFITFSLTLAAPIFLLLYINSRQVPISWHFPPTVNGLYRELTRRELSGYLLIQGKERGMYLRSVNLNEIATKIPFYSQNLLGHFGLLSIVLFSLGLVVCISSFIKIYAEIQKKQLTWWKISNYQKILDVINPVDFEICLLGITSILTTVLLPLYVEWPTDLSLQSIRIRLYLTGYVIMPLIITIGTHFLIQKIIVSKYHFLRSKYYLLPTAFMAYLLIYRLPLVYSQTNLRQFDFVSRFYSSQLAQLPPNSLLACLSDVSCFALMYAQQIDGIRPDVVLLPHGKPVISDLIANNKDLHGFEYSQNPQLFLDYISWNLDKRPVYVIELQQIYHQLLGLNYGLLNYLPSGYLGQITKNTAIDSNTKYDSDYSLSEELINQKFPAFDQTRLQLKASLAQKHFLNAITYQRLFSSRNPGVKNPGVESVINKELDLGTKLVADLPPIYQQEAQSVRALVNSVTGFDQFVPGIDNPTKDQILTQAGTYKQTNHPDFAIIGYTAILYQNPFDSATRLKLSQLYRQNGDLTSAHEELQNILKYDPQFQPAIEFVNQINTRD